MPTMKQCVDVWNSAHDEAGQVALESVRAVNTLWGFELPDPQPAPLLADAAVLAPAPHAAEATPSVGRGDPTDLEKLATDFAALSLRLQRVEKAGGVGPTPEVCETLRLQAMTERVSSRLDEVEKIQRKQQQQRRAKG